MNDILFNNDYISLMTYISNNYFKSIEKLLNIYNHNNIKMVIDIKYFFPKIKSKNRVNNSNNKSLAKMIHAMELQTA